MDLAGSRRGAARSVGDAGALLGAAAAGFVAGEVVEAAAIGVDEICCLIDFGVGDEEVLAGLEPLDRLRQRFAGPAAERRPRTKRPGPGGGGEEGRLRITRWMTSM